MKIQKAVITAAGPGQSALPLQSVVDQDGISKTTLQLILHETTGAGIGEVCMVVRPGDETTYRTAAGEHAGQLSFVEQDAPRGYGDALFRAKDFVGDDPFLHLVSDHLYISRTEKSCARQLMELAASENCSVSAVQATRENQLKNFGAVGARRVPNRANVFEVDKVIEKPTPTFAEQELVVAGLRSSHYLCLFGMHVLTPTVMQLLEETIRDSRGETIQLSPALSTLAQKERYLATEIEGDRYNIGVKYGLLRSQLALALAGHDRDEVLTDLLDLVASTKYGSARDGSVKRGATE